ncbi:uncharacterized protein PFL1_03078 [Pseudozyma flocculosa PF-1]|uniref:Transcription factor CBF/NF-Y/archaeal histone domain-containing protein n=2 Tax=Pseudozyma flocculosa TaxID=84751 RepID=A0A5C3F073_9BASI|nr:uncharacterized protein PFL1_03078 [Pseudozyma flocculosa PF-1]EPQ29323.1 hypothetical protein PFL1_03078 [Pseudozyma flocculosa PF-1]SPO37838.1 uncharacterized protein PSFLO_03315 [Pseudozyma flocculosa]
MSQERQRSSATPQDTLSDANGHNNDTDVVATAPDEQQQQHGEAEQPKKKKKAASASKPGSSGTKRQRGTSTLPTARVQRIIKADRDVDICSREATFLISAATELFVKKFVDEAYTNARLDKRKVVSYKDMSKAVQQNDYLDFLKAALAEREAKMTQIADMEAAILAGTLNEDGSDDDGGGGGGRGGSGSGGRGKARDDDDEGDDGAGDEAMADAPAPVQRPAKKVKAKSKSAASKAAAASDAADEPRRDKSPVKRTARQSAAALAAEARASASPAKADHAGDQDESESDDQDEQGDGTADAARAVEDGDEEMEDAPQGASEEIRTPQ